MGPGLDRILSLSNKRMPSGHYLKDDPCYIEFTGFDRIRDISPNLLQPADMQWSVDEFLKKMDSTTQLLHSRIEERTTELSTKINVALEDQGVKDIEETQMQQIDNLI